MDVQIGHPEPIRTNRIAISTDHFTAPLLQVRYFGSHGEDWRYSEAATIAIDADGDDSSGLLITLSVTKDGTTTYDLIAGSATVDASAESVTTAATLGAVVTAINALDGWEARLENGLASHVTASAFFIDLASTWMKQGVWTDCLYQKMVASSLEETTTALRNYAAGKEGLIRIHGISVNATFATTCTRVVLDADGNNLMSPVALTTATLNTEDLSAAPRVFKGPVHVGIQPVTGYVSALGILEVQWSMHRI